MRIAWLPLVAGCGLDLQVPCDVRLDLDRDGADACADCDDADPDRHPGAVEVCNGVDDDCDGTEDVDAVDAAGFVDADGDGFGDDRADRVCDLTVAVGGDCDDSDATVAPSRPERWNGVDDDCDGTVDRMGVEGVARTVLHGDPGTELGTAGRLGWGGDLDGDGGDDLVAVQTTRGDGASYAWVVPVGRVGVGQQPLSAWSWSRVTRPCSLFQPDCFDTLVFRHALDGTQGPYRDLTGSGRADLVLTTYVEVAFMGPQGEALMFDGAALEPDVNMLAATSTAYRIINEVPQPLRPGPRRAMAMDVDGDGVPQLVVSGATDGASLTDAASYGAIAWFANDVCVGMTCPAPSLGRGQEAGRVWGAAGDALGSLLAVGDVDGDGAEDLVAGAPGRGGGQGAVVVLQSGAALAAFAPGTTPSTGGAWGDALWAELRGRAGDRIGGPSDGLAVGSLSGDAFADLAVSSSRSREVRVWWNTTGDAPGVVAPDDMIRVFGPIGGAFGASVCIDSGRLWVGDPTAKDGEGAEVGAVYLFGAARLGAVQPDGALRAADADAVFHGDQPGSAFGSALLCGVDVDGDSVTDVAIGAPRWDLPGTAANHGALYVVPGR